MLSALKELDPRRRALAALRAQSHPNNTRRACRLVRVPQSNSVLFAGMHGSVLPIAVAHGEGRAEFASHAGARDVARITV